MSTVQVKRKKQRKIVLGPDWNGAILAPEEFDAINEYDDNYIYELVHGVVVVNPIPLESEVGPNEVLGHWLLLYKETHPQGSALNLTLPERYIPTKDSRRRADRVIWAGLGRLPNWKKELPTIAAEFVSRDKRDRHRDYVEKRQEYMEIGIEEYWLFDRFERIMTVFRCSRRGRIREIVIREGETYITPLLPGFELNLAKLLEIADQLADPD